MIERLLKSALPSPMTPEQRRRRLFFWTGVTLIGVVIWFLADLVPHSAN